MNFTPRTLKKARRHHPLSPVSNFEKPGSVALTGVIVFFVSVAFQILVLS